LLNPERLRRELAGVRRDGCALDCGEDNPSACCVAAPIVDEAGQVTAAIAVMAPAARLRRDEAALIAAVRTSAHAIGALLPLASPRAVVDSVDLDEPEAASPAAIAAGLASLSRAMSRVS
jgi:transcriptional regulator of acetoin/glycerol metabolism